MNIYNPAERTIFVPLEGDVQYRNTAASTWEDLDLSALVGSAEVDILLNVVIKDSTDDTFKARTNGSAFIKNAISHSADNDHQMQGNIITRTDSDGVIEIYTENEFLNDVYCRLIGKWAT